VIADQGADGTPAAVTLQNPLSPAEAQAACGQVELLLAKCCCDSVICDVSGTPDLRTVDVLARLTLLTRRSNTRLVIRAIGDAAPHLAALVALTGLECLDRLRD
jgi:hypothetical protein